MEMVMANGFAELSANELVFIDGGIDWRAIGAGCGIMAAGMFAIACAPASALVGAAYGAMCIGAVATGAGSGAYIGYGLTH